MPSTPPSAIPLTAPVTLGIAQLNLMVGDMAGNAQKILQAANTAYAQGARLLLTPELSICGYAAEDLFLRPAFISLYLIRSQYNLTPHPSNRVPKPGRRLAEEVQQRHLRHFR